LLSSGLDNLLADSLHSVIKDNLGEPVYKKIESRLQDRYKITVLESIRDFSKMDATLRELFQEGADEIEKKFLNNFISIEPAPSKNKTWITIHDQSLANLIMASFSDSDKRKILNNLLLKEPTLISDIVKMCNLTKSTGYRMIKELTNNGLLTEIGYSLTSDGRKMNKYVSLFENMQVNVVGGKLDLKVQINNDFLKQSQIIQNHPMYMNFVEK